MSTEPQWSQFGPEVENFSAPPCTIIYQIGLYKMHVCLRHNPFCFVVQGRQKNS